MLARRPRFVEMLQEVKGIESEEPDGVPLSPSREGQEFMVFPLNAKAPRARLSLRKACANSARVLLVVVRSA